MDRCPYCGNEFPAEVDGLQLLYCPSCGEALKSREKEKAEPQLRKDAIPSPQPPPVVKLPEKKLDKKEEKILAKAQQRLKLLERFLSSAARVPLVLRDPGTGETLRAYKLGFASVRIAAEGVTGRYFIDEPALEPEDILAYSMALENIYMKANIPEDVVTTLSKRSHRTDVVIHKASISLSQALEPHIRSALKALGLDNEVSRAKVTYYVARELFGYGVVNVMMEDPEIEDINCIGPGIYVAVYHRGFSHYRWLYSNAYFRDDDEVNDFMNKVAHAVGHGLTVAKPYGDFALPSGDRFAGIFGRDLAARGPGFTIRKFAIMPWSLPHIVKTKVLSPLMAAYLWFALEQKAIIGLAGPTGSGKTSLFNALLACLHPNAMFYTIEDTYEIYLPHRGWRATTVKRPSMMTARETQVTEAELIKMALRMRPDYIVVGEVRSEDAVYHLLNAAFTGHGGGFTFHADSSSAFFNRLAIMLRKSDLSESLLSFFWGCGIMSYHDTPRGRLRRMMEIAEIVPDPSSVSGFRIETVAKWTESTDTFEPEGVEDLYRRSPKLNMLVERMGASKDKIIMDIERKAAAISEGIERGITDALEFHEFLKQRYYAIAPEAER
ncbi:MAG: ATPase, T2SS/T4P/T4SS family [Candidatus Caldarchaeum sp.]